MTPAKPGAVKLKDLTARQVQKALAELSASLPARPLPPPVLSTRVTRSLARGEQLAAPAMRAACSGTILVTGGGFADHPIPALATVSLGKAGLRSAATMLGADLEPDGIRVATLTIAGKIVPGTSFDPERIAERYWEVVHGGRSMAGRIPVYRRVGDGLPEVKNPRLRALADAALAGDPDAARLRAMPSDDAMA